MSNDKSISIKTLLVSTALTAIVAGLTLTPY